MRSASTMYAFEFFFIFRGVLSKFILGNFAGYGMNRMARQFSSGFRQDTGYFRRIILRKGYFHPVQLPKNCRNFNGSLY